MRTSLFIITVALSALLVACGLGGGGKPVPELPSDFQSGATIPGWVVSPPIPGRAEVTAEAVHEAGRWTTIFSRPLRATPRDVPFSIAVANDGLSHSGATNVRWTADPNGMGSSSTLVARRVRNGSITPDGVGAPAEWSTVGQSSIPLVARNNLPTGHWPTAANVNLIAQSAYDDEFVYFLFRWNDPAPTRSELGPLIQWTGTEWVRRPHRTNDVNGDGLLLPTEPAVISAAAEDEDRLSLFWPIHDQVRAYRSGGSGCAVSCHQNDPLNAMGFEAVHAWLNPDDRTDVWQWRAAATAAGRRLDDWTLRQGTPAAGKSGGGSGFVADEGALPFTEVNLASPQFMFATSAPGFQRIFEQELTFTDGIPSGYPTLMPIAANAAAFDLNAFNGSTGPPTAWSLPAPAFGNNFLPAFVHRPPSESRADLQAGSAFLGNQWVVEIRRKRITRDASGSPREDDIQFDHDVDLFQDAFLATVALEGAPFSISITDAAHGHGVRETQFAGPLRLASDPALAGPALSAHLALHDYGAGFQPIGAADFADPRFTRPSPSLGADVDLVLKAGTDGGQRLFVLASWADARADAHRDQWTWNGFTWVQAGEDDEFRLLWGNGSSPPTFGTMGCGAMCDLGAAPLGAPSGLRFGTDSINQAADLWHWRAGLTQSQGFADDLTLDWRFFDVHEAGSGRAATHPDAGGSILLANRVAGQSFPTYMSPSDPNASAPDLTLGVASRPDAIFFVDVTAGLPPPPPPPGTPISFASQVLPILQSWCTVCHPPSDGLNLTSWSHLLAGSQNGAVVLPLDSAASPIIQRLMGQVMPRMPLGGTPLPNAQIDLIAMWIDQGALNN